MIKKIYRALCRRARTLAEGAVQRGADPKWFRYRAVPSESLRGYGDRRQSDSSVEVRSLHPIEWARNPLPRNISSREELPKDRGWWGYSFWDVPERRSGETLLATLPNCRIVPRLDERKEFWVSVVNDEGRALQIREMAFREEHRDILRDRPVENVDSATWLLERVFHNYSHWLTAHLPKLLLFRQLGLADQVLLPKERPAFIDKSLQLFGFDPASFSTFDPDNVLRVKRLTLMDTDRFRPELLRLVREHCPADSGEAHRRVFISRAGATRRRLLNEEELWPLLEERGFERIKMESLDFAQQVKLMQETAVLCAPHGAGLTNMLFCRPGAQIVEMADLSFPNPNFYAVASAMGLPYWIVSAEGVGDVHPLEKDMRVDPGTLDAILARVAQRSVSAL